jgi:molecular chaperone GrpE
MPDEPALSGGQDTVEDKAAEFEDRWRRTLADLDNVRKRFARELRRGKLAERNDVTAAWLPVLDNLELALAHAEDDDNPVTGGVRAVRDQAVDVLARLGYARQDEAGVPFDPHRHEVVGTAEDPDHPDGTVLQVVRPGYGEDETQLRPAAVVVNRRR